VRAYANRSTSPSFYLEVVGTAAVTDLCGPVGSTYTNPIIAIPPGQLSTYENPVYYPVGSEYRDINGVFGGGFLGAVKPLHVADLACPTWGLGRSTNKDGTVHTTVGPPWLPLIVPPRQVLALDPDWNKLCVDYLSYLPGMTSFAIFDPPRALSPVSEMGSSSTQVPVSASAIPTTIVDPPGKTSGDPALPAKSPSISIPDPTTNHDPPSTTLPTSKSDPQPSVDPGVPIIDSEAAATPGPGASPDPSTPPDSSASVGKQESTQSLGAMILSAFGGSIPGTGADGGKFIEISTPTVGIHAITIGNGQVLSVGTFGAALDGSTYSVGGPAVTISGMVYTVVSNAEAGVNTAASIPNILTIAGEVVTPNPSGMIIGGSSLSPGGPGVEISKTSISLDPSGNLFVNGKSIQNQVVPNVFTLGSKTFTANPAGFNIDGKVISPGRPGQNIDGTVVSLGQSGILHISSQTLSLPNPQSTGSGSDVFTVGGQVFTANSAAFSIDGTTISAGGPAVTINGTIVSLEPSGILDVGTNRNHLLVTQTASSSVFTLAGLTVEAESSVVAVNGVPLQPGGQGITVNGHSVSLEQGGTLDVGSDRFPIPTGSVNGTASVQAFKGAQRKGFDMPWSLFGIATLMSAILISPW